MPAGIFTTYGAAVEGASIAAIDFDTDTFVCILVSSAYTPDAAAHSTYADVSAHELATAGGYTVGGVVMSPLTVTRAGALVTVDSVTNPAWAVTGTLTPKYAVVLRRAGGSLVSGDRLVGYLDLNTAGGTYSVTDQTVTITWSSAGLFAFLRAMPVAPVTHTGNLTLAAADLGVPRVFDVSSATTLTLPALASVPVGANVKLRNQATSTRYVTIDPNAAETIAERSSELLLPGESCELVADSSTWHVFGITQGWRLLSSQSASASTQIDVFLPTDFSAFRFEFEGVRLTTDNITLFLRTSTDGGLNFDAGASDYLTVTLTSNGVVGTPQSSSVSNTGMVLAGASDNTTTGWTANGTYDVYPGSADHWPTARGITMYQVDAGASQYDGRLMSLRRQAATRINAIRFIAASGTIAVGKFVVYARV